MSTTNPTWLSLSPHAHSTSPHVRALRASVQRSANGLQLRYGLEGDLTHLRVAAARTPYATDELWRHTCFEAFIAQPDQQVYLEINLSPSSEWAAYTFSGYRTGMQALAIANPNIEVARSDNTLMLCANIAPFTAFSSGAALDIALCAVVEDAAGALSYWSLHHAGEQADFHDRRGFALHLPADNRAQEHA